MLSTTHFGLVFVFFGFFLGPATLPAGETPVVHLQLGHSGLIASMAFSHDGRLLASCSWDRSIRIWEVESGRELMVLNHGTMISSVAFSNDGAYLISGGGDNLVKLWHVAKGKMIRVFDGHLGKIQALSFSSDDQYVFAASEDHTLRRWETATGNRLNLYVGSNQSICDLAVGPKDHLLYGAGDDGILRIWDVATSNSREQWQGHRGRISALALSKDGKTLVSVGWEDQFVRVWDTQTRKLLREVKGKANLSAVALGRGDAVYTGDTKCILGRLHEDQFRGLQTEHVVTISSLAVSSDGTYLATGGDMGDLKLWKTQQLSSIRDLKVLGAPLHRVAINPVGDRLAAATFENHGLLWNPGLTRLDGHESSMNNLAFSPDGSLLVTVSDDHTIRIRQLDGQRVDRVLRLPGKAFMSLAFSADGHWLATGDKDGVIHLWDTRTWQSLKTLTTQAGIVFDLAFSPDRRFLATANDAGTVSLFDLETADVQHFDGHSEQVNTVDFSSDGQQLLSVAQDWRGMVRRVPDGELIVAFGVAKIDPSSRFADQGASKHGPAAAVFGPDGTIYSGNADGTLSVWSATTGEELRTRPGHASMVRTLALSADGRRLVTGSDDGFLKMWDLKRDVELFAAAATQRGHWAVVAPDGRFDADDLEDIEAVYWLAPEDRLASLPLEIFMRDYFEPHLMGRLIRGEVLTPIQPPKGFNRLQPLVTVLPPTPSSQGADLVDVRVRIASVTGPEGLRSGVDQVHLFRDKQLVGIRPGSDGNPNLVEAAQSREIVFPAVKLPRRSSKKEVVFSAYAFNSDGIKSKTHQVFYTLPPKLKPKKGKAVLIAVGINSFQEQSLKLDFALNDARTQLEVLAPLLKQTKQFSAVISVLLASDKKTPIATADKATIRRAFARLSGQEQAGRESPPALSALEPVGPEDLVIISFSTHGYAEEGRFYLFPQDMYGTLDAGWNQDLARLAISDRELVEWLQPIDAGRMVVIIDACQSAAVVRAGGFKPGPLGSRGFGQLAFNKKMWVLAASQSNASALESADLQHGYLSFAILREGLGLDKADQDPVDGRITLSEWLQYGRDRVPSLYLDLKNGVHPKLKKFIHVSSEQPPQKPELFNFSRPEDGMTLKSTVKSKPSPERL